MKICKVAGCNNKHDSHGYCNRHARQITYYGKILERTMFDPNEIINCGNYYEICLYKHNPHAIEIARTKIDKEDLEKAKDYKWSLAQKRSGIYVKNHTNGIYLHQLIMGKKKGYEIDHINHNRLDNRKSELRFVTSSQNSMNSIVRMDNTSGYKGVVWDKAREKWASQLCINNKQIHLGRFINKQNAIKVRKQAEQKYFGEFAYKN